MVKINISKKIEIGEMKLVYGCCSFCLLSSVDSVEGSKTGSGASAQQQETREG